MKRTSTSFLLSVCLFLLFSLVSQQAHAAGNPTAVCQDITVQLDNSGNVTWIADDVDGGSSAQSCTLQLSIDIDNAGCSDIGTPVTVELEADDCGTIATCQAFVTVEDIDAPTINCPADVTVSCNNSTDPSNTGMATSTDNCTQNPTLSSSDAVTSSISRTWTATDDQGNSSSCTQTITEAPSDLTVSASATDESVQNASDGTVTATASSSCTISSYLWSNGGTTASMTGIAPGSYTVTVTDGAGETATASATVNAGAPAAPSANCQDITIQLNGDCEVTLTPGDIDAGSGNAQDIDRMYLGLPSSVCPNTNAEITSWTFGSLDQGTQEVTLYVVDNNGNTTDCEADVLIEDNTAPTAVCSTNITVTVGANGLAPIGILDIESGSSDNCGIVTATISTDYVKCCNDELGQESLPEVTLTVYDAAGNSDVCTTSVNIVDNTNPVALCNDITVYVTGNEECSGANDLAPPVGAQLDDFLIVSGLTYSAMDGGSSDNCGAPTLSDDLDGPYCCQDVGGGPYTVTVTATDPSGNTATCTSQVTVLDTTAPMAICQDVTVTVSSQQFRQAPPFRVPPGTQNPCQQSAQLPGGPNMLSTSQINNGSSDNCGIDCIVLDQYSYGCGTQSPMTVTMTVYDFSQNSASCTAQVTIVVPAPTVSISTTDPTCPGGTGSATATANSPCLSSYLWSNGATTSSISATAGTYTVTVTDGAGQTASASATINDPTDNTPPTMSCNDITVQLDAQGAATITAGQVGSGTDDCSSVSLSASPTSFDCNSVGANTVTLTGTDASQNSSSCTSTVTVEDNVAPTAVCSTGLTVAIEADGGTIFNINNGSSDACGILITNQAPTEVTCADLDGNGTVDAILSVTDNNQNTSSCTTTVTVVDNINPEALCQDVTVTVGSNGFAVIDTMDIDNGSSDNCTIVDWELSQTEFSCENLSTGSGAYDVCTGSGSQITGTGTVALTGSGGCRCLSASGTQVTLTVTDASGNSDNCTANVTVVDEIAPTVTCQDVTIMIGDLEVPDGVKAPFTEDDDDDGGYEFITSQDDNCGIDSSWISETEFGCTQLSNSPLTVEVHVWDYCRNEASCTATVTVTDGGLSVSASGSDPSCPNSSDGSVSSSIDNGACGPYFYLWSTGATTSSVSGLSSGTYTVTITDNIGRSATASTTITGTDTSPPTVTCAQGTITVSAGGSLTASQVGSGTDDCSTPTMSISPSTFSCSDIPSTTVTLTGTDASGNSSSTSCTVVVSDDTPPTAVCSTDVTIILDAQGSAVLTTTEVDNGSSDNCPGVQLSLSQTSFDCEDVTVPAMVDIDHNDVVPAGPLSAAIGQTFQPTQSGFLSSLSFGGYSASVTQSVTVELVIGDPNSASVMTSETVSMPVQGVNANDEVVVNFGNPASLNSGSTYSVRITPSASWTVLQSTPAQNNDYPNGSMWQDVGGGTFVDLNSLGQGNYDLVFSTTMSQSQTLPSVTLTATDGAGNTATCTANITVLDNTPPNALCQDITVSLGGQLPPTQQGPQAPSVDNGSSDNCGIASYDVSPDTEWDCSHIGTNNVTMTITDLSGNTASCTAVVTVVDVEAPSIVCPADVTVGVDQGQCVATVSFTATANDNCPNPTVTYAPASGSTFNLGTATVTATATDVSSNTASCTFSVTVEDDIAPTAVCSTDVTVTLDATGNGTLTAAQVDNGSTDNCPNHTLSISPSSFDCEDIPIANQSQGPTPPPIGNSVTLTVTDAAGNTASCTTNVVVEDNIAPTALCKNTTVVLDPQGTGTIKASDVDNNSFDNCDPVSLSVNTTQFDCEDIGNNTVTLTVTDPSGNSATCTATVIVTETTPPVASCQPAITVQLDAQGVGTVNASSVDNNSTDNCGPMSFSFSPSYACSDVGNQQLSGTLTVSDAANNTATCTTNVTVEDNVAPAAICKDATLTANAQGQVTVLVSDVDNGSNDACGIQNLGVSPSILSCSSTGSTVTLEVIDLNGNISTCTATITINGGSGGPLQARCKQNVTIAAPAVITTADIDDGSTGGCGATSISITPNNFDCTDIGPAQVTLTISDGTGASSTCISNVNVVDADAPVALCKDVTFFLPPSGGQVRLRRSDINNGSSDNCAIVRFTASQTRFTCADFGDNFVTMGVFDAAGQSDFCQAKVTILGCGTTSGRPDPSTYKARKTPDKGLGAEVFPNPFTTETVVGYSVREDKSTVRMAIYNKKGQQMWADEHYYESACDVEQIIRLDEDIADGVYFIRITDGKRKESVKIIKQSN